MEAYAWKKAAAGIFFPRRLCVNCGSLSIDAALCPDCRTEMVHLRRCPCCATFVAATETADYRCQDCRGEQPAFALVRAALPYTGHLREQLLDFKYNQRTGLRRGLTEILLLQYRQSYATESFNAVLPIPLSAARLASRGYNQAQLLSELVAAELGLPHQTAWLQRIRDTKALAELKRSQRTQELQGAFRANTQLTGQRLLLIDDIFTTGATMNAAARALLKAGAGAVYGLTVAAAHDL